MKYHSIPSLDGDESFLANRGLEIIKTVSNYRTGVELHSPIASGL
jgi:hypothetical protein